MMLNETTWLAIVNRTLPVDGKYQLANAEVIVSVPAQLVVGEDTTIEYLKEMAKEKKVKGYALMGEKKLKEVLNIA